MRILLVDTTLYGPTTPLFRDAVAASGHTLRFVDEGPFLEPLEHSLLQKVAYRLRGRRPLSYGRFNRTLVDEARAFRPDVVLIVKGTYVAPAALTAIKDETGAYLINYATDDPFNPAHASPDLLGAIPQYDLYCSTKRAILGDLDRAGCRRPVHTWFAYKPELHFPEAPGSLEERDRFASDVAFVGGADSDRLPYIDAIADLAGVNLALYGGYWQRHDRFRAHARGFAVGRDYRLALGGTRIALCLVRQANRDGHVMRTFEIPACGAFMLAEDTAEHRELFDAGSEAAFFRTPAELAEQVRYYLARDDDRRRVAHEGHRRVVTGGHTYGNRLAQILALIPRR
jgi:hypothetical protein